MIGFGRQLNTLPWNGYPATANTLLNAPDQITSESVIPAPERNTPTMNLIGQLADLKDRLSQIPGYISQFPTDTVPKELQQGISADFKPLEAYRADPTGKYGGKEGIETRPIKLEKEMIYSLARSMAATKDFGTPQLSPQELAAFALKEGRSDLGTNDIDNPNFDMNGPEPGSKRPQLGYDPLMKGDKEFYDKLTNAGVYKDTASFLTRLHNKQKQADRLGIPLPVLWNGTKIAPGNKATKIGVFFQEPRTLPHTGEQYGADYKNYLVAAAHPKNAPLISLIKDAIQHGTKTPFKVGAADFSAILDRSEKNKSAIKKLAVGQQ